MKNIKEFTCDKNLTQYIDSMLFDSNKTIASMTYESDGCIVNIDLMTRGYVNVEYKGESYYAPSEFPEELKEIIRTNPYWYNETEDLYISENNWFEYIYDATQNGKDWSDGILFEDDLSKYTEDELKSEMVEVCKNIIKD